MSAQVAAVMQIQKLVGATDGKQPYVHMGAFGDDTWADPYSNQPATSPPMIAVADTNPGAGTGGTAATIGTAIGSVAKGLVGIFTTPQYPPGYVPPQPTPLWVYALVGIGGVVAVGFVARSLRSKRRSVAGYRRRHHRR